MIEFGKQHPMEYREEITTPLFERIRQMDSFAVIGGGSMGKTRLLDFVMRQDVQQHFLEDNSMNVLLVRADCNRVMKINHWYLYEMLLTGIIESCGQLPKTRARRVEFNNLREPVIVYKDNALLALRHLELAVAILTQDLGMRVCFLLDEFDEMFRKLKPAALANLRGIRDANKNQLCYGLFFRHASHYIRSTISDCEGFNELFSHRLIPLTPYSERDAMLMIGQLEARRERRLLTQTKEEIYKLSGGHPGLISVLFDISIGSAGEAAITEKRRRQVLLDDISVQEECAKLWNSLREAEKDEIQNNSPDLVLSDETKYWLTFKGMLINDEGYKDWFSPLFRMYVEQLEPKTTPTP